MAATMAVLELPPKFSRKSQVNTESRKGIKSPFFFLDLEFAWKKKKYFGRKLHIMQHVKNLIHEPNYNLPPFLGSFIYKNGYFLATSQIGNQFLFRGQKTQQKLSINL